MSKSVVNLVAVLGLSACAPIAEAPVPEAAPAVVTQALPAPSADAAEGAAAEPAVQEQAASEPVALGQGVLLVQVPVDCTHLDATVLAQFAACAGAAAGQPSVYVSDVPCDVIAPEYRRRYAICVGPATGLAVVGRAAAKQEVSPVTRTHEEDVSIFATSVTGDDTVGTDGSNSISRLSVTDGVRSVSTTTNGVTRTLTEGMDITQSEYWPRD